MPSPGDSPIAVKGTEENAEQANPAGGAPTPQDRP